MMRISNRGFTLLELLIVATLFSLIGAVFVAVLSNGIKVYKSVLEGGGEEKVIIFLDKFSRDLRNTFVYKSIKFKGEKWRIEFPTIVVTHSKQKGLKKGVGKVIYYWDDKEHTIVRMVQNLSDIYKNKLGERREVLKNVSSLYFSFYIYDEKNKKYIWVEELKDNFPLAVEISFSLGSEDPPLSFSKRIFIPIVSYLPFTHL